MAKLEKTKYTLKEVFKAYREQYEKSVAQLGDDVMPRKEMYSKKDFQEDWLAIKSQYKGMSAIRAAEKLARSEVYLHTKPQAQAMYKSLFKESIEKEQDLKTRLSNVREALNASTSGEERRIIEDSLKQLEKEEKALKKEQSSFVSKFRTGKLDEEIEDLTESFYSDISERYREITDPAGKYKYSGKQAKAVIAREFFSWKYV